MCTSGHYLRLNSNTEMDEKIDKYPETLNLTAKVVRLSTGGLVKRTAEMS